MVLALIAAAPPTLAAICALIVGVLNHRQGQSIHLLVNSNLAKVQADLTLANQRISDLQTLVQALRPSPVIPEALMKPPSIP